MKTLKYCIIFLISVIFAASSCFKGNTVSGPASQTGFAIYFLQDSALKYNDIINKPINSIKISYSPVVTEKNIKYYKIYRHSQDQSHLHAITFEKEMNDIFGNTNRPFIVVATGDRIYIGEYWAQFMDTKVSEIFIYPYTSTEFHIMSEENGIEKINDNRILPTLLDSNIEIIYQDI